MVGGDPAVAVLLAASLVAATSPPVTGGARTALVVPAAAPAVVGGGPVASVVLRLAFGAVARSRHRAATSCAAAPGSAPSNGPRSPVRCWPGGPRGVAVAMAITGLGRYPELAASAGGPEASEKFIIGTFASVLWAVGAAGVVLLRGTAA